MLEKLQKKWNVSPKRLWVILSAFAIGGSLCGYLGRKILMWTGLEKGVIYLVLYIIIITLLWPICVILISSILGEYAFFKKYLQKIFSKINWSKTNRQYRIAIFASGGGSNAEQIMRHFSNRSFQNIQVVSIVSNNLNAGVLDKAKSHGLPYYMISKEDLKNPSKLLQELESKKITHIVLAGFLQKISPAIINAYPDKIINIHPALLPKYGGKGMYGHHVHEAVKENKETESGISIHLVNEVYDEGKIIFQTYCSISEMDTAEEIAANVLKLEHQHYALVIEGWILNGTINSSLNIS